MSKVYPVLKGLFIVVSIAVWCIVLKQFIETKDFTSQSAISELKLTPTGSSILPTNIQNIDDPPYCPGTDWIAYKDEQCFKLITKFATREEAVSFCRLERLSVDSQDPYLASIKNGEEQGFLSKLLFTDSKPNVWIGAQRRNAFLVGGFSWEDDSPVTYSNWAQSPSSDDLSSEKNCVEMHKTVQGGIGEQSQASVDGKWRPAACQQANYFVCQKPQRWPLEKLQRAFLNARRDLYEANEKMAPLGFIYVQLHSQRNPSELWPQFGWLEISGNYSGTFLRVEGGAAAPFGQIQEENAGGQIKSAKYTNGDGAFVIVGLDKGQCSNIRSGGYDGSWNSIQFCTRGGELRPQNMAVKVWKRVK